MSGNFSMTIVNSENSWPLWPWIILCLAFGGFGNNSKLVTDLAPCLVDVPKQSLPVSPPITTTFLASQVLSNIFQLIIQQGLGVRMQ